MVITWSRGAQRIKGWSAEEILGRHFSRFYPAEDVAAGKPAAELVEARANGRLEDEGWRVRKDGTRFWADVVISALRDAKGELRGFVKVTRDLTERRRAEAAREELVREQAARAAAEDAQRSIQQSEARYQRLSRRLEVILAGVDEGITVQDATRRLLYANGAAATIAGLVGPEEMVRQQGQTLLSCFELDDAIDPVPPGWELTGSELEPSPFAGTTSTLAVRHRDSGRRRWLLVKTHVVEGSPGEPELLVHIFRDITREHREQQNAQLLVDMTALLTASLDYEATLERLAHALVPRTADWCSIDVLVNGEILPLVLALDRAPRAALAKLRRRWPAHLEDEYGTGQVVRTGRSRLLPQVTERMLVGMAKDRDHLALLRELGMHSMMVVPLKAWECTVGAMMLVSAESRRTYDEHDVAVMEEIGRLGGIALENARLYREAQRAVKVRDDFFSVAGHELKTPLSALSLQLQNLEASMVDGALFRDQGKWRDRAQKMTRQVHRLARLIRELLDVSRIGAGVLEITKESLDLVALTREVVDRHRDEARRGAPAPRSVSRAREGCPVSGIGRDWSSCSRIS